MMSEDDSKIGESFCMNTYALQPVVLERGEGCYLFDTNGKKYLDFAAGIAVASLGHAHPVVLKAIEEQARKMMICVASYLTEPRISASRALLSATGMDKIFFCNSGTEAVEGALKLARKKAHLEKGESAKEIIAFAHAFHGRSYGSASITYKSLKQKAFNPYVPGVRFATFNDSDSVRAMIGDQTAAVVIEPVQGEGGVNPVERDFFHDVRTLCTETGTALIVDEIQTGMGRTGTLLACDQFGIQPDILTLAKGLGSGFPVGAILARDAFSVFVPGEHGSTYGANPLACAVVGAVLGEIARPDFLSHVQRMAARLRTGLLDIQTRTGHILAVRGLGLMIGVESVFGTDPLLGALREEGLLATKAGDNTLRLTPPLIAGEREIDCALEILERVLSGAEAHGLKLAS